METRRGKYWASDPKREEAAKAKRERRQLRNIRREFRRIVSSGTSENPGSIRLERKVV